MISAHDHMTFPALQHFLLLLPRKVSAPCADTGCTLRICPVSTALWSHHSCRAGSKETGRLRAIYYYGFFTKCSPAHQLFGGPAGGLPPPPQKISQKCAPPQIGAKTFYRPLESPPGSCTHPLRARRAPACASHHSQNATSSARRLREGRGVSD